MALRKVVAFIGLLGVISALAWQHGLFDRADAASPEAQGHAEADVKPAAPVSAVPAKAERSATKRLHSKR